VGSSADLRSGSELLGYRIERILGRGGMGVVYLAHQLVLDRMVALKLLTPELADDEAFRARFLRESRMAASLDHPSIVPIFDAGEVEGRLYITMRYVEGTDLSRLLDDEAPLEPARALAVLRPIADALDAAAARGLVHRDVKPSNILLDGTDRPYLADFGLSKETSERGLVESSHFAASVEYVAPEQVARQPVGQPADVYALGCVLYECLTGRAPFHASSVMSVLFAHLNDPPPSASEGNRTLPKAIDAVLEKALAKEPEQRHTSARNLIDDAEEALGLTGTTFFRDRRQLAFAGIGLATLAIAGVAAILLTRGGSTGTLPRQDSLVRIDPQGHRVTKRIAVGHGVSAVALGAGAVWVSAAGDSSLWRVDPRTGATHRVTGLTDPGDVVVTRAGNQALVYVGNYLGVAEIGPALSLDTSSVPGVGPSEWSVPRVSVGKLGVWVGDSTRAAVERLALNPTLGGTSVVQTIPIPRSPNEAIGFNVLSSVAVGDRAVWATGDAFERALFRIDPHTRNVARYPLPSAPGPVAAGAGAVWVAGQLEDVVWRVDVRSGEVTDTIPVGRAVSDIAVGARRVWVASPIEGTVSEIDPRARKVVETVRVGGLPQALAADADEVWVASRAG
jgi:tRNA A-37 threonylcarbamoyl transferase component Bud32/streptogramin lyase